jgi:hypothetical protein
MEGDVWIGSRKGGYTTGLSFPFLQRIPLSLGNCGKLWESRRKREVFSNSGSKPVCTTPELRGKAVPREGKNSGFLELETGHCGLKGRGLRSKKLNIHFKPLTVRN